MYAELQTTSNFSFLRGASHPQELVWRASELGYKAIALTDFNSLAGIVRAHTAAIDARIQFIVGCRLELTQENDQAGNHISLLVYPKDRDSYGQLCKLLTTGKRNVAKNEFRLTLKEFIPYQNLFVTVVVPPFFHGRLDLIHSRDRSARNLSHLQFYESCKILRENSSDRSLLSVAATANYGPRNHEGLLETIQVARALDISIVATNDVYYHTPERKPLQDVLTCIREKCTLAQAGYRLFQNSERYLKPALEMKRLFREIPGALSRTIEISEIVAGFTISSLRYLYPDEICPESTTPLEYLRRCVFKGAHKRYPGGIPQKVLDSLEDEFKLIHELEYEKYFLTCYDIVSFARERGILCQGRGAAANSAVCYCLGITSVDPHTIDLLFARFVSKERREPPDIDIDFEHERREEVIQYIYKKYGRDRAAITAEVVTYRARSAVREVGKALGLSLDIVDKLAKSVHRWTDCRITADTLREIGLNPFDPTVQNALVLSNEIVGFPRHLSQHVGGFVISQPPLYEIVPIVNAGMPDRTMIEWDKNDIEELGMLKIDVLALGMLTCIRKALDLINQGRSAHPIDLHTIPANDSKVYDMLCAADSLGVFQVESRAQMSMLPRLKPRCFYDLVIEVAIVRPGPIQGNMVHPYLRRRAGLEKPFYPDERVANILGKTLGVPIFQEQAMRLAITLANFSPGEAEKLRRAMAAWKTNKGVIALFKEKIIAGMKANGYSQEFAETCLLQIQGFSEYGFPESHAASFALLVYASAWIKCHYPAEFCAALLNSQPMGFYAPSQIIRDAQRHGVEVVDIDVNKSGWNCSIERTTLFDDVAHSKKRVRLGLRLISGLREAHAGSIETAIRAAGHVTSISELWNKLPSVGRSSFEKLASADAFRSIGSERRLAYWDIRELPTHRAPLDPLLSSRSGSSTVPLPKATVQTSMFQDYSVTGFSLRAHPLQFAREALTERGVVTIEALSTAYGIKTGSKVACSGLVTIKQRPGTAKGVVFLTIEDETGCANLIVRPSFFEAYSKEILHASVLIARGTLERIGEIIYVDVTSLEGIDTLVRSEHSEGFPSRSYSY